MKIEEIKARATEDLRAFLRQSKRELWEARFANQSNRLDDTSKIRKLRRQVARVRTVLSMRQKPGDRGD